jgi:hypothetical protein
MKSIWKDLLFMHGHITDPRVLNPQEAAPAQPPGNVYTLPNPIVQQASIDQDPAIHAKAWQECA